MNDPDDDLDEFNELLGNLGGFAAQMRALYDAFKAAGFTDEQCMEIIIATLTKQLELYHFSPKKEDDK